jgi:hypothetical protein
MKVFVPMPDDWMDARAYAGERLVPYRAGMALLPDLPARSDAAPQRAAAPVVTATDRVAASADRPA